MADGTGAMDIAGTRLSTTSETTRVKRTATVDANGQRAGS